MPSRALNSFCRVFGLCLVGPHDLTLFGFRPSNRVRLKSAPGMFGVSLQSTGVSVALQFGPSGASLSGRVKS